MNLALIGNGVVQALLDESAGFVWMCLPRFDSSYVFGSLVCGGRGEELGGRFSIDLPDGNSHGNRRSEQAYEVGTAIVRTVVANGESAIEITDFAPMAEAGGSPQRIVRMIKPVRGQPEIRVTCDPRDSYGQLRPEPHATETGIEWQLADATLRLHASDHVDDIRRGRPFALTEPLDLVLDWGGAGAGASARSMLDETRRAWAAWLAAARLPQTARDAVVRSAITLKLHQYQPSGGFTAATTTSIPEFPGSGRNWDYRFMWPRDAYFSLSALAALGLFAELPSYLDLLGELLADGVDGAAMSETVQPLYGLAGERELTETVLDHLPGLDGNGLVRIGNGAASQKQFDVFGEMLATIALAAEASVPLPRPIEDRLDALVAACNATLGAKDAGLWEKRDDGAAYTFTSLAHWLGGVSAARIGRVQGRDDLIRAGDALAERARERIESRGYRPTRGFYADAERSDGADASLLLMACWSYFDSHQDPHRAGQHVDALVEALAAGEHLLYRYRGDDGLGATHAAFTVCAFWWVEALAKTGDVGRARTILADLLSCANHVGLYSEDLDPKTRAQLGNFPQTYSHAGLIHAAVAIDAATR